MKKTMTVAGVAMLFAVTAALALGILNLPLDPVSATHSAWEGGTLGSTLDITLGGIAPGFDVIDGTYAGWCMEDNHQENFPPGTLVLLYDSTDDPWNLPLSYQDVPWDKVNYLLNHKAGTAQEIQAALWNLFGTEDPGAPTFPVNAAAQAMIDDAQANGTGFVPATGQVVAVPLFGDGLGAGGFQDTLIEVPVTPQPSLNGCTPGFWRNHLEDWAATGLSPDDDFDTTFGVDFWANDITLGEAVRLGGGGLRKVTRHGTAALLNALHPDIEFPYTPEEVIQFVQAEDDSALSEANEIGCNL